MFSKLTILIYCLPLVVYIFNSTVELWLKIAVISCYSLAFSVLLIIYLLRVDIIIESGKAPVERLNIAYKFLPPSEKEDDLNSEVHKISKQYPSLKRIFFYYTTSDVVDLGCAGGIILSDEIANDAAQKKSLLEAGFLLLSTPPVSYAVFSEYPVISWFPLMQWLACYRTYPRIHRYCEKHNLSAYPMVEIYDKKSVLFFAPLSRQDAFVVPEAEDIITRTKIKLEELEEEASEAEASNSEISDEESVASEYSERISTCSVLTCSERSSTVSSTISRTTTWSYHSTFEEFSDDEGTEGMCDDKAARKSEGLFRRSMSTCARTVKNILNFATVSSVDELPAIDNDLTIVNDDSVISDDTLVVSCIKNTDDVPEEKPCNVTRGSLRRSISKIASALNFLRSSTPQDVSNGNDTPSTSCAAELKLEIKTTESGVQCDSPCTQNSFQVPTVSFVGA